MILILVQLFVLTFRLLLCVEMESKKSARGSEANYVKTFTSNLNLTSMCIPFKPLRKI